mgnify:CR=1 FL=1
MTEGASDFDVLVYDVLAYEPGGGENRSHPIRAACDVLEDKSRAMVALVNGCKDTGLLPPGFPLKKSIEHIAQYGADHPLIKDHLHTILPDERRCLNLDPFREIGKIPEDYAELARAYDCLVRESESVGIFVFSVYQGDQDLDRIMQDVEARFPKLKDCFWLACANEGEPLSNAVKEQIEAGLEAGTRSVLFYRHDTAVLAARRVTEEVLRYPFRSRRAPRSGIATGFWTTSQDEVMEPTYKGPKNFSYYVAKYTRALQERAIKPEGLTPDDFDMILAAFKIESRFADDDQRYIRVSRALQQEHDYLLKMVTKL